MHDKILILDFGSQVTQLIARRVREAHVYCEIHPNDVSDAFVRSFAPIAGPRARARARQQAGHRVASGDCHAHVETDEPGQRFADYIADFGRALG